MLKNIRPRSLKLPLSRVTQRYIGVHAVVDVNQRSDRQLKFSRAVQEELQHIEHEGMTRYEDAFGDNYEGTITLNGTEKLLNFASNDYLGLNRNEEVVKAAQYALETHGAGLSSVRFICGTQDIHKQLEKQLAEFHKQDDCVLYPSGYNANVGLFEAIVGANDAIICDEGNHNSILDGTRFSKAKKYVYKHLDLQDLDGCLQQAKSDGADIRLVITQGAFPDSSDVAPLKDIGHICHEEKAILAVDDSHGVGVLGGTCRGTPEFFGVADKVHIINSTFSNALGGGGGGYTAGMQEVIDLIRQKARPYLFSNTLCPPAVQAASKALELISKEKSLPILFHNADLFREQMRKAGFIVYGNQLPNCPVFIGDHRTAKDIAESLLDYGILVRALFAPYVPNNKAIIRVNMNVKHTKEDVLKCVDAFIEVGKEYNILLPKKQRQAHE